MIPGWLSTFSASQRPTEWTRDAEIDFSIEVRQDSDLLVHAQRRLLPPAATAGRGLVGGRNAVRVDGTFTNGPRTKIYVELSTTRVLVIELYPAYSTRAGLLNEVLGTLSVTGVGR